MKSELEHDHRINIDQDYWTGSLDLTVRQTGALGAILLTFHSDTPSAFVKAESSFFSKVPGAFFASLTEERMQECWRQIRLLRPLETVRLDGLALDMRDAASAGAPIPGARWVATRLDCGTEHDTIALVLQPALPPAELDENLAKLGACLPELSRSVEFGYTVATLRARSGAALYALDRVRVGVLITDPKGMILLQNLEAKRILGLRDGLSCDAQGRLQCGDAVAQQILREYGQELAGKTAAQTGTRLACAVRRPSGMQPFILDAVPLEEMQSSDDWTGAFMTIIDPAQSVQDTGKRLRTLFGLTDSEAEVCSLISQGWTNAAIAQKRGVSSETVKSQVSAILHKTGVTSRVDLARLVTVITSQVEALSSASLGATKKKPKHPPPGGCLTLRQAIASKSKRKVNRTFEGQSASDA